MATKTADPAADPGQQGQGDGQGQGGGSKPADDKTPTMADVRREIREEIEAALAPVKELLTGKTGEGKTAEGSPASSASPAAPDLGKMVDDALNKVLGDRDRRKADDDHAAEHQRLAARAEVQPVDRPKRSKWLGNIWDK